ncbi:DUF485 domain-containing protein [Cupriavidus sp. WKF15]|uniref:DUF485 domain-containing protein n=1 Tax=Cupriavidus sp. WKF15 TaxID=3032282 RepID=UPI0023E2D04C|nr:DUF485 domain-containing protein [Cupriavidus sp. WKF15]WER50596.1 DUF485 domain-containing protein [Cupriavidus sp. WKF15]
MPTSSPSQCIREHPRFRELTARKSRLSRTLLVIVLLPYYVLLALVAFGPNTLRHLIGPGTTINVGILFAILNIVLGWTATAIYVHRANKDFDEVNSQILREVGR